MIIPDNKYLGTLCKRGHDWEGTGKSLRYEKQGGGSCIECQNNHHKIKYALNKDKYKKKTREYYRANKERISGRAKIFRFNNKEKIKKDKHEYHKKNRERLIIIARDWHKNNRRRVNELGRIRYNIPKNKEKIKKIYEKNRELLGDSYVKNSLRNSLRKRGLKIKNVPQDLIELKRAQLQLYRQAKE